METTKTLRRDNKEYQEIKAQKLGYKYAMRKLFLNHKDWKKISRAMGIRNVPTDLEDRLSIQVDIKRLIKSN